MLTPPGLTCCACGEPFRGALARRTPAGYQHAVPCPEVESPQVLTDADGVWVLRRGIKHWEVAA